MKHVVICGGSGTRLWPLSRNDKPKQFLTFAGQDSLYTKTIKRHSNIFTDTYVVTNKKHLFLIKEQSNNLANVKYILEPIGRNTAAAITFAALSVDRNDIIFITPSDHWIGKQHKYLEAIKQAEILAQQDKIIVLGISPQRADTGYGYIKTCGNDIISFHEKPNMKTAQQYIAASNCYWNSGIFCVRVSVYLAELNKYAPQVYDTCVAAHNNIYKLDNCYSLKLQDMQLIPKISVEHAILEQSKKMKMVVSNFSWSDVGSLEALSSELETNKRYYAVNSNNNTTYSKNKVIATIGIKDTIIIDTDDALLISKKGEGQNMRQITELLSKTDSNILKYGAKQHFSWGDFTMLEERCGYKVKSIDIKPGKMLPMEQCLYKNGHCIVASGKAIFTTGSKKIYMKTNESMYIATTKSYIITNESDLSLKLIAIKIEI